MPDPTVRSDIDSRRRSALEHAARLGIDLIGMPMVAIALSSPGESWTVHSAGFDGRPVTLPEEALAAGRLFVHSGPLPGLPSIVFIATMPVREAGRTVAVVSAMDAAARELTPEQAGALGDLASLVRAILASQTETACEGNSLTMRVDLSGRILHADADTERRLGYAAGALPGRNLAEIVDQPESGAALDGVLAQLGAGGALSATLQLVTNVGGRLSMRAETRLAFEHGVPVGVDLLLQDRTSEALRMQALEAAEQALSKKAVELACFNEHLRQLHRLATTAYASLDDMLRDYLRTGCEILRLPVGAVTAAGDRPGVRALYPSGATLTGPAVTALGRLCSASAFADQQRTFTYPFETSGIETPLESDAPFACCIGTPVNAGDDLFGGLSFCSIHKADIRRFSPHDREVLELMAKGLGRSIYEDRLRRERTRLTVELSRQAQQDPLTGLANRLQFTKHLESALAKATQTGCPLAVAFIDLDRFKQVNDTLGHSVGDEMLRQVAARLEAEAGPDESVARVGGDEFTIVFGGNPTRASVAVTAQRIIEVLRSPYCVGQSELFITASMGIGFFPEDASDARQLLQKADAAMYRCKTQGKNDLRFFTPDIVLRGANRMELETQLRRALEKEELRMCFMPLVSAEAGTLLSLEALLAWKNPRFGNVGASRFIPIAEESGMIIPIGAWVLNEVCRLGGDWHRRGLPPVRIAVNVSPLQFSRPDFVDLVSHALKQSGMPARSLELELTESMIMRDVEAAVQRMTQIRDLGISIAIDDFGTGYSSLSYLRRLPVDTLKIDQSFVAELGLSGTALPLIQAIVVLAHNIGLTVVAEGVETREQMDLLRAAGCDKLQGHVFGEPMTAESTEALLLRPGRDVPRRG